MYQKTKIEVFLVILAAGILSSSLGDFFLVSYHVRGVYHIGSFPDNAFLFSLLFITFGFSLILKSRVVYFSAPPLPERVSSSTSTFNLQKSKTHVFEEREPKESLDAFRDLITHGVPGLAIVRTNTGKMRQMVSLERTPVLWLSSLEKENSVSPADMGKLTYIVCEFLRKTRGSVIYVEGIEYLIVQNDFISVLKMVHAIDDLVALTGSSLIFTFDPHTLSEKERALLERGFLVHPEKEPQPPPQNF